MSVDGGDQADAIYVGTAATALTNFFGAGSVAGGNGADTIVAAGVASAGSISGGAGADSIMLTQFSGGLNSTFDATINGGAGTDTITFKTTANGLQLSLLSALASGVASVVYEAGDVITIAATAYTALAGAAANGLISIGSSAGSFTGNAQVQTSAGQISAYSDGTDTFFSVAVSDSAGIAFKVAGADLITTTGLGLHSQTAVSFSFAATSGTGVTITLA